MYNRLKNLPKITRRRTMFDLSNNIITTFNAGKLVPLGMPVEVLPGDTFKLRARSFIRMQTSIKAPMQNLVFDIAAFYVPDRIEWEHLENLYGQNDEGEWTEGMTEYSRPVITAPEGGWNQKSIASYMGVPIKVDNFDIQAIPVRGYIDIFNNWYRNENTMKPAYFTKGDETVAGSNGSNYITDAVGAGELLPVSKRADYFTRALPQAQKGPTVTLPLGKEAPVYTGESNDPTNWEREPLNGNIYPLRYKAINLQNYSGSRGLSVQFGSTGANGGYLADNGQSGLGEGIPLAPINLKADLSLATAAPINLIRETFQIQKYLERDALYGTRFREYLLGHFSVNAGDARLQIPEYLGGKSVPINLTPITQTSASSSDGTPQGNVAGLSVTADISNLGTHSFTEHGFIHFVGCVRVQKHSYQQGLHRMWSRRTKFDTYDPLFSNLGNFGIFRKELYLTGDEKSDNSIFGYQEYGADYRYIPDIVTGEIRDNADGSQSVWAYTDFYDKAPVLGQQWSQEDPTIIDKTLTVGSDIADQFIANFRLERYAARIMPAYSMPGLIDHH